MRMTSVIRNGFPVWRFSPSGFGGFIFSYGKSSHMHPDTVSKGNETETEVMASVQEGSVDQFIIADISRDGAYMTVALEDATTLPEWR